MARKSKSFGTKKIRAGSDQAREITRFIDERRARSPRTGSFRAAPQTRRPKEG